MGRGGAGSFKYGVLKQQGYVLYLYLAVCCRGFNVLSAKVLVVVVVLDNKCRYLGTHACTTVLTLPADPSLCYWQSGTLNGWVVVPQSIKTPS